MACKGSIPRNCQMTNRLSSVVFVWDPFAERVPPQIFRAMTMGRKERSGRIILGRDRRTFDKDEEFRLKLQDALGNHSRRQMSAANDVKHMIVPCIPRINSWDATDNTVPGRPPTPGRYIPGR